MGLFRKSRKNEKTASSQIGNDMTHMFGWTIVMYGSPMTH